jgi:hypothetical protein
MALMTPLPYHQVRELVLLLSEQEQQALLQDLIVKESGAESSDIEEKLRLLDEMVLDNPVREAPSIRRVDWYDDDGR